MRKLRGEERVLKFEEDRFRADIEDRHSKFKVDVNSIYDKYLEVLPLPQAGDWFKTAEEGAAFIASREGLCGWKVCASLAYKMAYDAVKNTNTAEAAIMPIVTSRIVEPIANAVSVYSDWTAEFRRELQMEDMAFAMDLAMRSHQFCERISVLSVADASNASASVDRFVAEIQCHARESAFAGVGAAVELALIKSSSAAIRNIVVKIATISLSAPAKKMAGTAAGASASAVADGPLPIGDIVGGVIAVGGLMWTSYDIYNVTKKMPAEMKAGIMEAIDETNKALVDALVENLKSDRDACLNSAEARVAELYNLIK